MKVSRFFPVLALVVAFAASAFTTRKTTNDVWYTFNSTDFSKVNQRAYYVNTYDESSPGCSSTVNLCAIKLPNSGVTNPASGDFNGLVTDIQDSQDNHSPANSQIQMQQ